MAIHWGSLSGRMKVGVEVIAPALTGNTTSATFRVDYYVDNTSYKMDDNQTLTRTGAITGTKSFRNVWDSGAHKIDSRTFTHAIKVGGGDTVTVGAKITGVFNGWSPSVSYTYSVPPRPANRPGKPPTPTVQPRPGQETTRLQVDYAAPSSDGGATITKYRVQVSRYSSMSSPVDDYNDTNGSPAYGQSNLDPGTTYYVRVAAVNAAGQGPWSNVASGATAPIQPSTPTQLHVTSGTPGTATITWQASATHGAPVTEYEVEVTDSTGTTTHTTAGGVTTLTVTTPPGSTVSARVRAQSSAGPSGWSAPASTTTAQQWWWGTTSGPVQVHRAWVRRGSQVRQVRMWVPDTTGTPQG